MFLDQNIKGICSKYGVEFQDFLGDFGIENVMEMSIFDLQAVAEENNIDLHSLIFKPMFKTEFWKKKLEKIKLLVLDVDGVMTDGGMYFTENGDQFKKYNTKDGMAILHLTKSDFQVAIISSGFKTEMVRARSEMLGIQHFYVGRKNKMEILNDICEKLNIQHENVAMVGDDVNDLEIIKNIGFSACPSDAVDNVKTHVDVILNKKGGEGCVREFIDSYLLKEPLNS
ncbi:MAG: HAD-IIIA family hydrolase [Flavobacteriia bacterium]|nr:HAD-IIIA family hydrolase [Flavobacteriia bacterium]